MYFRMICVLTLRSKHDFFGDISRLCYNTFDVSRQFKEKKISIQR